MTNVARLHALFADACFGDSAGALAGDLRPYLARHGIATEDAEALLASPRRLGLYRKLVRHNVVAIIHTMLEHTAARLERKHAGEFERTIGGFLEDVGPRTAHLRDVPSEFLAYAAPRWREDARLPPWLVDHAELELAEFTITVAPRPLPPPPLAEVSADRPLVFGEPKRLVNLEWAVNELVREDLDAEPVKRSVAILVYRDAEHHARFLELTPLAGLIVERLFAGDPLGPAIALACSTGGHPLSDEVLAGSARLLADLGERGVLLGGR